MVVNAHRSDEPGPPVLIASIDLRPVDGEEGSTMSVGSLGETGELTLLVECCAEGFPFDRYCRFVRQREPGAPYTFSSLEFRESPPGLRLGPWPGWRGIPEMPPLTLQQGELRQPFTVMFWGDERARQVIRAVCVLRSVGEGPFRVDSGDRSIVPRRVLVYRTRTIFAEPVPVALRHDLAGVHPRLLFTPDQVTALRRRAAGSHQALWVKILALLDHWELPYEQTPESKAVDGPQRLSAEDRVLLSAMAAMIEPGRDLTARALKAYDDYRLRTLDADFEPLRIDTQSGEVLFILCIGYDLLVGSMTRQQRDAARRRMFEVAEICDAHLGPDRRDYAQAHFLGCGLGLLAFSFLFWGEHPRAAEWAARLRGAFSCTLRLLPADGFYPHGINLWIYEFGQLLRWLELFRLCAGEDLWRSLPALPGASDFRAASLSPDALHGITMGDPQFRVGGDSWCHYLIASRTGSGVAQWLGETLLDLPHAGVDVRNIPGRRRVYEFLYFDPSIAPVPPTKAVFPDGGQVFVRGASSLFTYRSGPPLGRQRYQSGEYGGYGHSDPCNGAFLLCKDAVLIASGPGPVYRRDTALHNTITINGQGQIGDSAVWMPDFLPPEVLAERPEVRTEGEDVLISANIAAAYLPHLGVKICNRALCVREGAFVFGIDHIRCGEDSSIEWNAHAWVPFVRSSGALSFDLQLNVRLLFLEPSTASCGTGVGEFIPAYPNPGTCDHQLRIAVYGREARFVWCYLLDGSPAPHMRQEKDLRITFPGGPEMWFDGERLTPIGRTMRSVR